MLHILLLILKIIGIILAVIVGIILLLVGIVLFVPIRYEISAKCDGALESLRVKARATWLLHLLRADVFVKGTKVKWQVRAAWIKKSSAVAFAERKDEKDEASGESESREKTQKVEETAVKDKGDETTAEVVEEKCERHSEEIKEHRLEETVERTSAESTSAKERTSADNTSEKSKKEPLSDKVRDLLQKKEKITDFLTNESHIRAFNKIKKELFLLLKRLKPKKINVKVRFGFEDPCTTGQVLGGLSILYAFLGDTIEIIPDFENQILKGYVYLKGRIRFCHFAATALKLLLSKDIRTSYKDIRNFKL